MDVYNKLSDPIAFAIFAFTLVLPVLVGLLAMKRTKNQSDFFVGGRAMGKFVVALSAVSSGRSSWLVLGLSGMAYTFGTGAVWAIVGYVLAELFQFIYIGRKLRMETETYQSITLLDYFESRFNDHGKLLRIIGTIIIGIFMTAYVAAQFSAGAKALHTALNLPMISALGISTALVLVYMVLGGYIAVAYNDMVRGIIMLLGLVIFPMFGLIKVGGLNELLTALKALDPALIDPFSLGIGITVGFIGIGLGSPGQPHIVVRYMSIKDPDKLRGSAVIGTFWNVVMAWGAVFIGLLGRKLWPAVEQLAGKDPENIYLMLSSEYFGPVLYGLLVGGIFAAILSTADSQLLVVASTYVRDFYEIILGKEKTLSEEAKLKLSRQIVIIAGVVALGLAAIAKDAIFWLVLFAWGGMGAAFGTSLIFSLYWKKTTRTGIAAGMITGTLVTIIWKVFLKAPTGIYELIPAFSLSVLAIWSASLMTSKEK